MGKLTWTDYPLNSKLLSALELNNWTEPLPIQSRTLKATLIDNKHVLGAARTGSGKTLAYLIPLVQRILTYQDEPCSILKKKLLKSHSKMEDFDIVDGEMVSIEEMIVDRLSNESGEDLTDDDDSSGKSKPAEKEIFTCPEAIILVPTRELAMQVKNVIDQLCKKLNITSICLIGGLSQDKQLKILNKAKPQVIIGTPGRLFDIVQAGNVAHLNIQSIGSIRTLVIDEADRMMQKGHFDEMLKLIDIIKESKKYRTENFALRIYLFSATLTFLHELPDRIRQKCKMKKDLELSARKVKAKNSTNLQDHNKKNKIRQMLRILGIETIETRIIDLKDDAQSFGRPGKDQLVEYKINCLSNEKDLFLYYFIVKNPGKRMIVFCNSKDCLRRVTVVLAYLEVPTLKLHADMDQKNRLSSLEKFRSKDAILVATDVAARGLDIDNLECVIHYQVPMTCESYIHRSGRTARLSYSGTSLTLCEPKEVPSYRRICNNINNGQDFQDYEVDHRLKKMLKARVDLAQQCDKLNHTLKKTKSHRDWFVKAAKDCDISLDDEELDQNVQDKQGDALKRRQLGWLSKQLKSLLKKKLG